LVAAGIVCPWYTCGFPCWSATTSPTTQDNPIQEERKMTKNMGTADRTIRILVALVIAWLYYAGKISGTLAFVLLVVAVMFAVTSFVSWCPGYLPFGFSTRKNQGPPAA
jgi:hypothetical protein